MPCVLPSCRPLQRIHSARIRVLQAQTPTLEYTAELLYLLANVSSLVNAKWYLGELSLGKDATEANNEHAKVSLLMTRHTSGSRSPRQQMQSLAITC